MVNWYPVKTGTYCKAPRFIEGAETELSHWLVNLRVLSSTLHCLQHMVHLFGQALSCRHLPDFERFPWSHGEQRISSACAKKVKVTPQKNQNYILIFSLLFWMNKFSQSVCQGWCTPTPYIGDNFIPPLIVNPYNGYINHYYWVYDHPLLMGTNGNWSTPALKFTTDSPWSILTMEFLQFFLIWLCHPVSHSLFTHAIIHHSTENHNHQHSLYGIFTYTGNVNLRKAPPKKSESIQPFSWFSHRQKSWNLGGKNQNLAATCVSKIQMMPPPKFKIDTKTWWLGKMSLLSNLVRCSYIYVWVSMLNLRGL